MLHSREAKSVLELIHRTKSRGSVCLTLHFVFLQSFSPVEMRFQIPFLKYHPPVTPPHPSPPLNSPSWPPPPHPSWAPTSLPPELPLMGPSSHPQTPPHAPPPPCDSWAPHPHPLMGPHPHPLLPPKPCLVLFSVFFFPPCLCGGNGAEQHWSNSLSVRRAERYCRPPS